MEMGLMELNGPKILFLRVGVFIARVFGTKRVLFKNAHEKYFSQAQGRGFVGGLY